MCVAEHHGTRLGGWFLSARAVIANNGSVVEEIDTNDHEHLAWALGGARSGNFGAAVSLNIETVPLLPPKEIKKV